LSLFITFEGSEGCGKSTQAKVLWQRLLDAGIRAELTREPGGTPLGDKLRQLLKHRIEVRISPLSELLLFIICRAELVDKVILPGLQQGKVIICDRFADSTVAYQGYGRGLDMKMIEYLNQLATKGIKPDLTVLLDLPVAKGLQRKTRSEFDRFEAEDIAFHSRVRQGYLDLAAKEPKRWLVIDATLPKTKISMIVWERVNTLLSREN
jgi:dTMP kinase